MKNDCVKIQEILWELARSGEEPSTETSRHLAACEDCRKFYKEARYITSMLAESAHEPEDVPDLSGPVMQSITSKKPGGWKSWALVPVPIAVAAVIGFSLMGDYAAEKSTDMQVASQHINEEKAGREGKTAPNKPVTGIGLDILTGAPEKSSKEKEIRVVALDGHMDDSPNFETPEKKAETEAKAEPRKETRPTEAAKPGSARPKPSPVASAPAPQPVDEPSKHSEEGEAYFSHSTVGKKNVDTAEDVKQAQDIFGIIDTPEALVRNVTTTVEAVVTIRDEDGKEHQKTAKTTIGNMENTQNIIQLNAKINDAKYVDGINLNIHFVAKLEKLISGDSSQNGNSDLDRRVISYSGKGVLKTTGEMTLDQSFDFSTLVTDQSQDKADLSPKLLASGTITEGDKSLRYEVHISAKTDSGTMKGQSVPAD